MAKDFDQEVTVYIWKNAPLLKAATSGHVGHASLGIKGAGFMKGTKGAPLTQHISWWPESPNKSYGEDKQLEMSDRAREALVKGTFQPREGQKFNEARQEWEQSAEEKVRLPGLHATGVYFGLGLVQILNWWPAWKKGKEYELVSKSQNCTAAAAIALRVAGASAYATPPKAVLILEPKQILTWAKEVQTEIAKLNVATEEIDKALQVRQKAGNKFFCPEPPELITAKAWEPFASKVGKDGKEGKEILKLLGTYHEYTWQSDFTKKPDSDDFTKKMAALVEMTKIIVKLTQKTKTIPEDLEALSFQIIKVLRRPTTLGL